MNMEIKAVILLCMVIYSSSIAANHYSIVKEETSQKFLLLFKNTFREVPDAETATTLGFTPESMKIITTKDLEGKKLRLPPVSPLKNDFSNPDAVMAAELGRIRAITPKPLSYDYELICDGCKNPAVIRWHGQMLVVSEVTRLKGDELHIFWVNVSHSPLVNTNLFGISTQPSDKVGGSTIPGTDARIAIHPDTGNLIVAHYPRFKLPLCLGYAELAVVPGDREGEKTVTWTNVYDSILPDQSEFPKEKNWAPFFVPNIDNSSNGHGHVRGAHRALNETLLFVQTINPLHIVRVRRHDKNPRDLQAITVSSVHSDIYWAYGQLRSGSNPIRLQDRYLGFFHSIADLGSGYKTYFFGAYSFSLNPPFRMLSYSAVPIADERLYTGPWFNYRGIKYDYATYPMTLMLDKNKKTLHLSLGHNDVRGYICKLNVDDLLESMVPV